MENENPVSQFGRRRIKPARKRSNYLKQRNWIEPALIGLAGMVILGSIIAVA